MPISLVTVLQRASRGEATFAELAAALAGHDTLWAILMPGAMTEIQAAARAGERCPPGAVIDGVTTADGRFAARLILDDGTDHTVNLERPTVAKLYALLTLEDVARRPELHAVLHGGRLFLQPCEQGQDAFVYESAEDAAAGVRALGERAPGITTEARQTGQLLDALRVMGIAQLVVNPALPTRRDYGRDELADMLARAAAPRSTRCA